MQSPNSWPDTWIRFTTITYDEILRDGCNAQNQLLEARQWRVVELTFEATRDAKDPFDLHTGFVAEFDTRLDSNGTTMRVRAFWDGERSWKVRWSAPAVGCWTWRTECLRNSLGDKGLCNHTGNIRILPPLPNETNMLRRHGGFLHASNGTGYRGESICTCSSIVDKRRTLLMHECFV